MEELHEEEYAPKDTSYCRQGIGHRLRSQANKLRADVQKLLTLGALAPSDVEFITSNT